LCDRSWSLEMTVASCEKGQAETLGGECCLKKALKIPALKEHHVELTSESRGNLGRVATVEMIGAGSLRNVLQKDVLVSRKQIYVPTKADAETRFRLIFLRRAVCIKYGEVATLGQFAK